ncbi:hypothetical protein ACFL1T_01780 [Chlamydiota bacterium]
MASENDKKTITVGSKKSKITKKKSVVVHKKEKELENLYEAYGETERTIQELSGILSELGTGVRRSVGGQLKLTSKEQIVVREIEGARHRADTLLRLIESINKV